VHPGQEAIHFAQKSNQFWKLPSLFFAVSRSGPANASKHEQNEKPNLMNIISLIIEVISGAVGGNVAGAAMKENSLGTVGNSIAGIVGGGLGGTLLQMVMGSAATGGGSLDMTTILSNIAGGGVGGAILMAVVGIIKNKMAKN
jgi:uncharacterized membrane protein YeaQ/YmgE (transglycosylase-associated protein family)